MTVKELIDKMPEEYGNKFRNNPTTKTRMHREISSVRDLLQNHMTWMDSVEGNAYWRKIDNIMLNHEIECQNKLI